MQLLRFFPQPPPTHPPSPNLRRTQAATLATCVDPRATLPPCRRCRRSTPSYLACTPRRLTLGMAAALSCHIGSSASAGGSISFRLYSNTSSSVTTSSTSISSTPAPVIPAAAENPPSPTLDLLGRQLAAGDYRQADETTRALLIDLAGESAQRRGYVFFSEVQFISVEDLRAIDELWREHSNGKFGYSVQKRLWEKVQRDFTRFFIKVGWMKKLDTEIEQYNYRAFPDEFVWEMKDDTPEGHLPLTNALRGTQLLLNILTHPAFEDGQEEEATAEDATNTTTSGQSKDESKGREKPKSMKDFKPDYSF